MELFIFISSLAILLALSALFSGLTIGILTLNHYELKRKAQLGNKHAKTVYPIRALGHQLMITLLISNVIVNAAVTALLNTRVNGLMAVLFTTVFVVIFGEILPMAYLRKYGLKVAALLSPFLQYLILAFTPIARPLGSLLDRWLGEEGPSIYSKEELYKIFEEHKISKDSDIEADEVRIVRHALSFGDKEVRSVMTPRRMVVSVTSTDTVGPLLLDELYKSGYSRFPVTKDPKSEEFVGTLYLRDLVNIKPNGEVKDFMRPNTNYVHEEMALDHALRIFMKTNNHLLIVVNTFEEFAGVVSMEDIIEEIIGSEIVDEFDKHEDLREVAKSRARKDTTRRKKIK